jgi:hypothetical protein
MRILAASFEDEQAATDAMERLDREFGLIAGSIHVAGLGRASDPSGPGGILAGRFEQDVIAAVRAVVRVMGGTIVVDAEERSRNGSIRT